MKMKQVPESKFTDKRETIIQGLVEQNVFKINGRQLYETSLYELMKTYTDNEKAG
ncbi:MULTISPECIES: Fur-regulated basic protein FbpA [Planococcus]|uniref:Fur-regulated basic protein FbpA n=1 Tax=Planococcus TaxID=1372 RepID=UPI000A7AF73B|nr:MULTISPECIES: Fur-regulated basic protein FbpA [Planococcus]KAA0955091.1 Fur-regulated basic protein FbpA [Planococcus sp. ANT_H30]MDJ0333189.1 Fur-regulated basic protein FbpA [Planococcus sp. S3-L1]